MLNTPTTTRNENWIEVLGIKSSKISVLIIGNNPIEITSFYNILIAIRSKNYLADVCFNVMDSINRISKLKPDVIFIDDNLLLDDIKRLISVLRQNAKTQHIKIIALKSSNWNFNVINNVDDYILKNSINAEVLDKLIDKYLPSKSYQLV